MALVNLPAASFFTGGSVTNIQAKNAQNDMLAFIRQSLLGGADEAEYTISSGAIVPDGVACSVDTEGDASSDNLDNITTTNVQDGGFLMLRAESAARTVVIRHNQGGAGQIATQDGQSIILDDITKFVLLRRDGADFVEVFRTEKGLFKHAMTSIKTDNYTVTLADIGKFMIMNAATVKAFTLPAINSEIDGAVVLVKNIGTANLTMTPTGDSVDLTTLEPEEGAIFVADNTNSRWRLLTKNVVASGFSETIPAIKTANYSLLAADVGNVILMNSPSTVRTVTFPAISASNDGAVYLVKNIGAANCTLAKTGADTIEVTNLRQNDAVIMIADNTSKAWRFVAYYTSALPTGLNMASQAKGAIIYYNGTAWVVLAAAATEGHVLTASEDSGVNIPVWAAPQTRSQLFVAGGTFTAPAGITVVFVTLCGGGGGGGCANGLAGGGGGGGALARRIPVRVIPGNGYTVTVGAGGNGHSGSNTGNGTAGAASSFVGEEVTVTCGGGNGGTGTTRGTGGSFSSSQTAATPDASGQAGGGVPIEVAGTTSDGGDGNNGLGDNQPGGGGGGSLGPGGNGGSNGQPGNDGYLGAGGGGGGEDSTQAGYGGGGICLVEW